MPAPKIDAIAIHTEAHNAGMAAVGNLKVTPMVVADADPITRQFIPGGNQYVVEGGLCGFAWVSFKGNTAFGRAMKAAGLARPGTYGGLEVWVHGFGQSFARKECYARAYAAKLRELGFEARMGSRLD